MFNGVQLFPAISTSASILKYSGLVVALLQSALAILDKCAAVLITYGSCSVPVPLSKLPEPEEARFLTIIKVLTLR
ncbi:hypothetical protein D3C80_1617830 [compost metagenome]